MRKREEPGAYVHSSKKQTIRIHGRRGDLLLSKREADMVLADLQIMYTGRALDMEEEAVDGLDRRA